MTDPASNAIINFGDLSKPATVLIEKISGAIGQLWEPVQVRRMAKANTDAAMTEAKSEIEITDLHRRALCRFVEEEGKKQENIENITATALPHLDDNADASKMEDDWVTNFFDKCRIISDDEMQELWAKVLASEANEPGKFSKRTVNFLGSLDKFEAELFSKLCSFGFNIPGTKEFITPLILDLMGQIYNENGFGYEGLAHLNTIGLISFDVDPSFYFNGFPKNFSISYHDQTIDLEMPKDVDNKLVVGCVQLTQMGRELAPLCNSQPVDGFFEYVKEKWKAYLPKPEGELGNG